MMLFVYGDDYLRVKERTEDLKAKFLEKYDPAGMNADDFVVKEGAIPEIGDVLQAAQAAPFLSERRLVIIRGLVGSLKKADAKSWAESFVKVPATTVLLFSDDLSVVDFEKKELAKALKDVSDAHRYPLQKLEGAELITWAKERVLRLGIVITPSLLQELFRRTRDDAWRIDAELQKLAAYANGEQITEAMMNLLVRTDAEADIFALMDALASGNIQAALSKLESERDAGADDFQLYGMLLRQIRLLIQVRALMDAQPKVNKQDIATTLKLHPFVAQKMLTETKHWSMPQLRNAHDLALKLDRAMKSGIKPEISVDRLVSEWFLA